MPTIKIDYKPEIFDDPEFCEGNEECKFLDTGCCLLFDEPPILKPGHYYRKHDQCLKYWMKAKKFPVKCVICKEQIVFNGDYWEHVNHDSKTYSCLADPGLED